MGVVGTVVNLIVQTLMVFMPIAPYTTFFISRNDENIFKSFSLGTCYVLLTSNIFRISFYFGERYDTFLLIQSVVLISGMVALLYLSSVALKNDIKETLTVFVVSSAIVLVFGYLTQHSYFIVQSLGAISSIVEVMLALPQIYHNFKTQSGDGLPISTIIGWIVGDSFKTIYFIISEVPLQFICCGIFQLMCDAVIVGQMVHYSPTYFEKEVIEPLKNLFTKITHKKKETTNEDI
ncbi:hypothetical protein EIN_181590 [Entamoeba invadens IP1]|uniref:hypothetical protein n=1 Tax=Entamoeba invadens IP1 TaxID=370355 RepID=UPI0002C3EF4F|nr:hypothetical protein EIN_181590 [Entamoeba invadens IP1]ELP93992.1 hypothetical protein EIN_181590 [Entamoeba invadens IP1]|eukprot:XP_004260763.1 hypothetical protein EIN_181590 [Entamoeba invadens IP1]